MRALLAVLLLVLLAGCAPPDVTPPDHSREWPTGSLPRSQSYISRDAAGWSQRCFSRPFARDYCEPLWDGQPERRAIEDARLYIETRWLNP